MRRIGLLARGFVLLISVSCAWGAEKAGTLQITVVDKFDGEPVVEASAVIRSDGGSRKRVFVDQDGHAVLPLPSTNVPYELVIKTPGYAIYTRWFRGGEKPEQPMQIELIRSITIGGSVVDSAGAPVPGANITLRVYTRGEDGRTIHGAMYKVVQSDGTGRWSCEGVPAEINYCAMGFNRDETRQFSETEFAPFRENKGVLQVGHARTVEGVVRGKDGKPLAEASVLVGVSRSANDIPETFTDRQGRFSVTVVSLGELPITVQAPQHAPEMVKVKVDGAGTKVEVDLKPSQIIKGKIVDTAGRPLAAAYVKITGWRGHHTLNTLVHTGPDGTFSWFEAPADAVTAEVYKEGYARLSDVQLIAGKQQVLTLPKPLTVRATVVDGETGKPVEKFRVFIGTEETSGHVGWQTYPQQLVQSRDGRFEHLFLEGPARQRIRIEAIGYEPAESATFKEGDADLQLTMRLKRGESLKGVVIDAAGKPVADAQVVVIAARSPVYVENGKLPEHLARSFGCERSLADGSFLLSQQNEAFKVLVLHSGGYALVEGGKGLDLEKIALQPWGRIEGKAFIGSKPAAGAKVVAFRADASSGNEFGFQDQHNVVADEAGRFVIERISAGDWQVGRQVELGNRGISAAMEPAQIVAGATAQVKLGGSGRPVVGKVQTNKELVGGDIWGQISVEQPRFKVPAEFATMTAEQRKEWLAKWQQSEEGKAYAAQRKREPARNYSLLVDAEGNFRVDDVVPGKYQVRVQLLRRTGDAGPVSAEFAQASFVMPEIPEGVSDEPLVLPVMELQRRK